MKFVNCSFENHAEAILAIFNDAIINSTALYDYKPRTMDNMILWFEEKEKGHYPVIGLVNEEEQLMGFATYGRFRMQPAFKYTVEHSVYLHRDFRGQGIATLLVEQLIQQANRQDYHVMIGAIDMENCGSIALHQKLGFIHSGTINQAGYKFGRWLDLGLFQKILKTPKKPEEG